MTKSLKNMSDAELENHMRPLLQLIDETLTDDTGRYRFVLVTSLPGRRRVPDSWTNASETAARDLLLEATGG